MKKNDVIHCKSKEDVRQMMQDLSLAGFHAVACGSDGLTITITEVPETRYLVQALDGTSLRMAYCDTKEEADYFYEDRSDRMIDDDKLALLLMMPNVIVTSHQAFFTREATRNIALTTLQNIKDFEDGKELVNEVK